MKSIKHGELIKRLRRHCGCTQIELAAKIGRTAQVISNWERGYTEHLQKFDIGNLAKGFGVDTAQFDDYINGRC